MNKLSEEEIIKYIKDEIENETDTFHWFDDTPNNETRKQIEESINAHQGLLDLYEKNRKENTDLKELYLRIAEHQEKTGHIELAEYMLAQIQAIPTFTTWEEYTTWVSKDKIKEKITYYEDLIKTNPEDKEIIEHIIYVLNELKEE